MIDWKSKQEERGFIPPDVPAKVVKELPSQPAHIWMSTSGSTTQRRLVALSREALLIAAESANKHLKATAKDIWMNPLPQTHVGGLSIYARAHLLGNKVLVWNDKWNVEKFYEALSESRATLLSLVPTQLFDLVKINKPCPESIRAILIGGGGIRDFKYQRARQLGYPIIPSYGLTECSSQVATASLESLKHSTFPKLDFLSHVEAKTDLNGILLLKSKSLLTGYVDVPKPGEDLKFIDPKVNGWFSTEDHVDIKDGKVDKVLGRRTDIVKVSGELVHVGYLQHMWDTVSGHVDGVVMAVPDSRRENNIILLLPRRSMNRLKASIAVFEDSISSVTKLSGIYYTNEIPRSEIGKVQKGLILKSLGYQE